MSQSIRSKTSIRTKVTLSAFITVSVLMVSVSLILFYYFHTMLRESIFKQQYMLVSEIAEQLNGRIVLARHQLTLAAASIDSAVLADHRKLQEVLSHASPTNMIFDAGFLVIGTDGRVITESMGFPELVGADLNYRDYVREPLKTGKSYISAPFRISVPPGIPMIAMVVPVRDNSDRIICLLVGYHTLGTDQFLTSLSPKHIGESGYLYLIQGRTILMHPDISRIMEPIPEGINPGIDKALKRFEGSLENVNSRGEHMLSSFKQVGETGWILGANIPYDEAFKPLKQLAFSAGIISVIGILLSLGVVWIFTRRLTQPILQVIKHLDDATFTSAEWQPLDVKSGDEIERLAETFNSLVGKFHLQTKALSSMHIALNQQKAFAEGVLNKAAVPIFVLDVNHRIIVWNNALEDLTGLRAEDMIGTNRQWLPFYASERPVLADLILSADNAHMEQLYDTHRTSQHVQGGMQAEGWLENVGGQRRYLLFDAAPVFDADGNKLGVVETLLDISERKRNEIELAAGKEALQEQHKQLNKVFSQMEKAKREWEETMDCISDMVLMCDTYGKIKRCNHPVTVLTGLAFDGILGKNWMTLLVGVGIQVVDFDGQRGNLFDPKSGRSFEMNVSPIRQPGSPLQSGTVVSIHDTTILNAMNSKLEEAYTELQHTQSQILQQEKMASIGQLAAGVAHEINNPMGFISSNLSSLGKYMEKISAFNAALQDAVQAKGDPETLAALNDLRKKMKIDFILGDISGLLAESHDGAERVRRIVQDLKSFSHVDEAECKPFSINECLSSTLNMARNEIKYIADVEEEYDPELPPLNCYPQQLNQVFMNILVNAAHAIEGHGVIRVKTLHDADDIVVRISDTGKGIAPENLTRIFEPFFTTKEVGKGTGLGLSISYDIIKKHGGVMNVESEVGVGTTFIIRLPINHVFASGEMKS